MYTQKDFDRINNIDILSPERELSKTNFELSNALLYTPPTQLPLDYFKVDKEHAVLSISIADLKPKINNRESLYKSKTVQVKTNFNQASTVKIKNISRKN